MGISRTYIWILLFFCGWLGAPQTLSQNGELVKRIDLQPIMRPAGYIFAGRVTAIEYKPSRSANEVATVRITFTVEPAIRGTTTGTKVSIREWAGLWNSGERYRVGERLVLFYICPAGLA